MLAFFCSTGPIDWAPEERQNQTTAVVTVDLRDFDREVLIDQEAVGFGSDQWVAVAVRLDLQDWLD